MANTLLVRYIGVLIILIALFGLSNCDTTDGNNFKENDVREIRAILEQVDPSAYRIQLPVFEGGKVVGHQVYGKLPILRIERRASTTNQKVDLAGNLQAIVFQECNGGGPGTMQNAPNTGKIIAEKMEKVLQRIDKSQYTYLR